MQTMRLLCIVVFAACIALAASEISAMNKMYFWNEFPSTPGDGDDYRITLQLSPVDTSIIPGVKNEKDSYDFQFNAFRFFENVKTNEKGLNMYANSHYILDFSNGDIDEHKITKIFDLPEHPSPSLMNIDIYFHMLNGEPDKMAQYFDVDIKLGLNDPVKKIKSAQEKVRLSIPDGQMNNSKGVVRSLPDLKNGNLLDGRMIMGRIGNSDQIFVDLQLGKPPDGPSKQGRMYFLLDVKNGKVLKGKNPFTPQSSPNQIRVEFNVKKDVKNHIVTTDVELAKGNDTTNTPYNKHLWIDPVTGNGTSSTKIVTTKKAAAEEVAVETEGVEDENDKAEASLIIDLGLDTVKVSKGHATQYLVAYTVSKASAGASGQGLQYEYPVQDTFLVDVMNNTVTHSKKKLKEGEHKVDMRLKIPLDKKGAINKTADYVFESGMGKTPETGNAERPNHVKAIISPSTGTVKIGNQTFQSDEIKKGNILDVNFLFGRVPHPKSKSKDKKLAIVEVAVDFGKKRLLQKPIDGAKSKLFWTLQADLPSYVKGAWDKRIRGNAENLTSIDFIVGNNVTGGGGKLDANLMLGGRSAADFGFLGPTVMMRKFSEDTQTGKMEQSLKTLKIKARKKDTSQQYIDNFGDDAAMAILPDESTEPNKTTTTPKPTTKPPQKPTSRKSNKPPRTAPPTRAVPISTRRFTPRVPVTRSTTRVHPYSPRRPRPRSTRKYVPIPTPRRRPKPTPHRSTTEDVPYYEEPEPWDYDEITTTTTRRPRPTRRIPPPQPPTTRRLVHFIAPKLVPIPPKKPHTTRRRTVIIPTPRRTVFIPTPRRTVFIPTPRRSVVIPPTRHHKHRKTTCKKKHRHPPPPPPTRHHHDRPSPCNKDPCDANRPANPEVNNNLELGNTSVGVGPLLKGGNLLNVEINSPTVKEVELRQALFDVIQQYKAITYKLMEHMPPSQTKVLIFPNVPWEPEVKRQVIDNVLGQPGFVSPVIEHPRGPIIQVPFPELILQEVPGNPTQELRRVTVTYEGDPTSLSPRVTCTCRTDTPQE